MLASAVFSGLRRIKQTTVGVSDLGGRSEHAGRYENAPAVSGAWHSAALCCRFLRGAIADLCGRLCTGLRVFAVMLMQALFMLKHIPSGKV